jgi:nicotinate-nucleotide pyrophosphorylase (carboxylating)
MTLDPLPVIMIEPLVRAALLEDLGRAGDLTSDAIVHADLLATATLITRQPGVVAGLDLAALAFRLLDERVTTTRERFDGDRVAAGQTVGIVKGPARAILSAERTALNFLCRLSGIASATASLVEAVRGTRARIVCTRKTTPGLRAVEKYAVRAGGGANHRFGLDDAILIKDNHIAIAGDVRTAIERARARIGHLFSSVARHNIPCGWSALGLPAGGDGAQEEANRGAGLRLDVLALFHALAD